MSDQQLVLTRTFDAPPALVFRAFTDPDLVPRWWVAGDEKLVVEELDPRAGGSWRYVDTEADGSTNTFHGVFHSVAPDRIVQTFEYGGLPGTVMLETLTFQEVDGRTLLTDSTVFQSTADRDAMGGGDGFADTMDRLAELLRTL